MSRFRRIKEMQMRRINRAGVIVVAAIFLGFIAEADDSGIVREARRTGSPPTLQDTTGDPLQETRLEVAMGEWAVTLEKDAVRPGITTFVIRNRGTKTHGFRIRSAGSGRDRFERRAPLMSPGGTSSLTLKLVAGTYRVDCYVEEPGVGEHDRLGMRATLTVAASAPLTGPKPVPPGPNISIANFFYVPQVLKVKAGTTVVWTNNDPTPHTINADDGSFRSRMMEPGTTFSWTFETAGTFPYKCMLHPGMKGTVEVSQ